MNFAEKLAQALKERDVSQQTLAEKAGVSKSAMSMYLSGERMPRREVVIKIADALEISAAWLEGHSGKDIAEDIIKASVGLARETALSPAEAERNFTRLVNYTTTAVSALRIARSELQKAEDAIAFLFAEVRQLTGKKEAEEMPSSSTEASDISKHVERGLSARSKKD